MENTTKIQFVLQGLNDISNKHTCYVVILLAYIVTIFVNMTLIITIIVEKTLHEPMLIFLCSLCVNGIFGASTFYPKLLVDLSSDLSVTSYTACFSQIVVLYSYVFCEFNTLAVMAYDRYVAICKPLNYHSIITPQKVVKLLLFTWLISICESLIGIGFAVRVPLCGFKLQKIYCTTSAVVKLSCADTTISKTYGLFITVFHVSQVVLILISYVNIVKVSVRSQEGRKKFMQTCSPHLISLTNFTAAIIFDTMFARFGTTGRLQALHNFMSLDYLVVPPILNPLIYGFKMNQIRRIIFRTCSRKIHAAK